MVFEPGYTPSELLLEFSKDVLLISGTYGSDVDDIFTSVFRSGRVLSEGDLLPGILAILGVKTISMGHEEALVSDLYVPPQGSFTVPEEVEDVLHFLRDNRVIHWEDEMKQLLDGGHVTSAAVKQALSRNRAVVEFLSHWDGLNQSVLS